VTRGSSDSSLSHWWVRRGGRGAGICSGMPMHLLRHARHPESLRLGIRRNHQPPQDVYVHARQDSTPDRTRIRMLFSYPLGYVRADACLVSTSVGVWVHKHATQGSVQKFQRREPTAESRAGSSCKYAIGIMMVKWDHETLTSHKSMMMFRFQTGPSCHDHDQFGHGIWHENKLWMPFRYDLHNGFVRDKGCAVQGL
jgi:hypothetical protein